MTSASAYVRVVVAELSKVHHLHTISIVSTFNKLFMAGRIYAEEQGEIAQGKARGKALVKELGKLADPNINEKECSESEKEEKKEDK